MKKRNVKTLKLIKKSISNLTSQQIGGRVIERSKYGGITCLTCPSYATMCLECPSGQMVCETKM